MPYQDIYRHGAILEKGERECTVRWEAVQRANAALAIPQGRTILDLGAAEGYFSVRWAETFPGDTVVACDPAPALLETAQAHPELPIIVCRKPLTPLDLWRLGQCEHVDLTLCLNLLHHFGLGWADALEATLTLGDGVLYETPDPSDTGACHAIFLPEIHRALMVLPTQLLARLPSHTSPAYARWLQWVATPKSTLARAYWEAPPGASRPGAVHLYSGVGGKCGAWPRKGEHRLWWPGINLATYLALDGQWPTRAAIATCIRRTVHARTTSHGDIRPWNWIVTADPRCPVQLIDAGDWTGDDAEGLAWTLAALEA